MGSHGVLWRSMGHIWVPWGPKGVTWGMGVRWDPMKTHEVLWAPMGCIWVPWESYGVPGGPDGVLRGSHGGWGCKGIP